MGSVFLISNFFINKNYCANKLSSKKNTFLSNSGFSTSWDKKMFISVCTLLYVVSSWTVHSSEILVKKSDSYATTLIQKTECRICYILWFDKKKYCAQLWSFAGQGLFQTDLSPIFTSFLFDVQLIRQSKPKNHCCAVVFTL